MLFLSANDLPTAGVSFLYVVTMTHGAVEGTDMMSNKYEMMSLERLKLVKTMQPFLDPYIIRCRPSQTITLRSQRTNHRVTSDLSFATTMPSSWSSRPSRVIMKLRRETLVDNSGR